MFLVRLEGGSCINYTATTDNAVQKYYLRPYILSASGGCQVLANTFFPPIALGFPK
jgi:hypothetical protein